MLKNKDLLSLKDLAPAEIQQILALAKTLKQKRITKDLTGKTLGMLFKKSSTRTRVSFEVAMTQLGGHAIFLSPDDVQLNRGETIGDTARVLSRYVDGMVIRTFEHKEIEDFARYATIPVINGLSDWSHPCQVLSDMFTIVEKRKKLKGLKVAYIGDGSNNMATSWIFGAAKTGMHLAVATPDGYPPDAKTMKLCKEMSTPGSVLEVSHDPQRAAAGADVLYTDVWVSMGQEKDEQQRLDTFAPYQINRRLLEKAKPGCLVMHCLPAHRGQEITDDVLESRQSIVFDQAENRLHVQKAILKLLLSRKKA